MAMQRKRNSLLDGEEDAVFGELPMCVQLSDGGKLRSTSRLMNRLDTNKKTSICEGDSANGAAVGEALSGAEEAVSDALLAPASTSSSAQVTPSAKLMSLVSETGSPLTPRALQARLKEASVKVDDMLRHTTDVHSQLAAQDVRLGMMQQGLSAGSSPRLNLSNVDLVRQHINDLRSVVADGGHQVPGALQHVQRMLTLLASHAAGLVDDPASGREILDSIELLGQEVIHLMDLAAKGEQTAGQVATIRRTLENLQQDVTITSSIISPRGVSASSPSAGSMTASSQVRQVSPSSRGAVGGGAKDLSRSAELAAELAELRAQVSQLAARGQCATADAAAARQEVAELREHLQFASAGSRQSHRGLEYSDELAACTADLGSRMSDRLAPAAAAEPLWSGELARIPGALAHLTRRVAALEDQVAGVVKGMESKLSPEEGQVARSRDSPIGHEAETLLVSKQLVQNLRQELLKSVEGLQDRVDGLTIANNVAGVQRGAAAHTHGQEQRDRDPETLLAAKRLVQDLRQELLKSVEGLQDRVDGLTIANNVLSAQRSPTLLPALPPAVHTSGQEQRDRDQLVTKQELTRAMDNMERQLKTVSTLSPRSPSKLSLEDFHAEDVARLVETGLGQLRKAGNLTTDELGSGDVKYQLLKREVDQLSTNVSRNSLAAEDTDANKKNVARLWSEVNKMKERVQEDHSIDMESIDRRFREIRQDITEIRLKPPSTSAFPSASATLSAASGLGLPAGTRSDFAALREGLNNLKIKHATPG